MTPVRSIIEDKGCHHLGNPQGRERSLEGDGECREASDSDLIGLPPDRVTTALLLPRGCLRLDYGPFTHSQKLSRIGATSSRH